MSEFHDAIGDMTDDLLAEAGSAVVYLRGRTRTTVTLYKSPRPSVLVNTANGLVLEVHPVDFIGETTGLPYETPERGDRIISGSDIFELSPTVSEKVFRRVSPQMTRLFTKQVAN